MVSLVTKLRIPDDWITREEAAALRKKAGLQGADPSQIWRWVERGFISYRPVGSKGLVSRTEVLNYPGSKLGKPSTQQKSRPASLTKEIREKVAAFMAEVRAEYPNAVHEVLPYVDRDGNVLGGMGVHVWPDKCKVGCLGVVPVS
jgi:hypothetical protein